MRKSNQEGQKKGNNIFCPDCKRSIENGSIKQHIETCEQYVSTYINNVNRVIDHLTPDYLEVNVALFSFLMQKWILLSKSL